MNLKQELAKAWKMRFNQEIEACLLLHSRLKSEIGFRDISSVSSLNVKFSRQDILNLMALEVSLLRARKLFTESSEFIKKIELTFVFDELVQSYHFLFEKGLTLYVLADYQQAMDLFMLAIEKSDSTIDALAAQLNLILCMENLSIPYQSNKENLNLKIQANPDLNIMGIRAQLEALELRENFKSGKLLTQNIEISEISQLNQAVYYKLWASMLPTVSSENNFKSLVEQFSLSNRTFYNKAYRLRTLLGQLHEEDLSQIKIGDLMGRIYLWTWQWLSGSTNLSLDKLTKLLAQSRIVEKNDKLTEDDRRQLSIVLKILSLFDPISQVSVGIFINKLNPAQSDQVNYFDYENLILNYILAIQKNEIKLAQDYKSQIVRHSLYSKSSFAQMLFDNGQGLAGVKNKISGLVTVESGTLKKSVLRVDLLKFEIRNKSEVIRSASLCLILELFRNQQVVTLNEIMDTCFGISEYDPYLHLAKINNLLARVKMLLGRNSVRMKEGRVYFDVDIKKIDFYNSNISGAELRKDSAWRDLVAQIKSINGRSVDSESQKSKSIDTFFNTALKSFKRVELEKRYNISRASAQRALEKWARSGKIKRKGHGRNIIYIPVISASTQKQVIL